MKSAALFSAAAFAVVGLTGECLAQSNSLFGNSGPAAGRTTGTTATRGATGGAGATGALGARGGTGTGLGAGAGAGTGLGGTGLGGTGIGGTQAGRGNTGTAGAGAAGFIGRNANAGRFVGQQQAGQQTGRTNRTFRAARTGGDPTQVNRNAAMNQGRGGAGNQQTVRPVLRVAFNYPNRTMATIRTRVQSRFQSLAVRQPRFRGITLNMDGNGQVVLRGAVESESVKSLAANLARLEPGVREVKNELTVRR